MLVILINRTRPPDPEGTYFYRYVGPEYGHSGPFGDLVNVMFAGGLDTVDDPSYVAQVLNDRGVPNQHTDVVLGVVAILAELPLLRVARFTTV